MRAATLFSSATMAAAAILLFSSLLVSRTSAFHPTTIGLSSSPTMFNAAAVRVVSTELHYASSADNNNSNINNFSELDKLRAKRKNLLRRPSYQQQPSASAMPSMPSKKQGLEYLYDQSEERHADDFFHVILMPSTFTKNQVSIEHATESILSTLLSSSTSSTTSGEEYTYTKIRELTTFTKHQVFTLLGTWTRSECLDIGHQLQEMDLDVRVIPYSEGLLEMNTAAAVVASSSSPPMRSSSPQLSSLPSPSLLEETSSDGNDDKVVVVGGRSSRRSSATSSSSDYLLSL